MELEICSDNEDEETVPSKVETKVSETLIESPIFDESLPPLPSPSATYVYLCKTDLILKLSFSTPDLPKLPVPVPKTQSTLTEDVFYKYSVANRPPSSWAIQPPPLVQPSKGKKEKKKPPDSQPTTVQTKERIEKGKTSVISPDRIEKSKPSVTSPAPKSISATQSTDPHPVVRTTPVPPTSPQKESKSQTRKDSNAATSEVPTTYSSLSAAEHVDYLELDKMWQHDQKRLPGTAPLLDAVATSRYFALRARVVEEQERYRQAVMKEVEAHRSIFQRYPLEIKNQVEAILDAKRKRSRKKYPRYYKLLQSLNLSDIKVTPNDPLLKHEATLLQKVRNNIHSKF